MQPGVLGLLALPTIALLGRCIAKFASQRLQHISPAARRLSEHSIFCVACGTVFWFWAAFKVLTRHDPDMGVVSFLIANTFNYRTADLCAVLARRPGRKLTIKSLVQQRWAQPATTMVVAVNYALALLIPSLRVEPAFIGYLLVGASCWTAAALHTRALHAACDFGLQGSAGPSHAGSDDGSLRAPLTSSASDVETASAS